VAVLYDSDSKFALASQAPFGAPGQYLDPDSYRRIVAAFYRGVFDAGLQARLVRPQQLFASRGGTVSPAEFAREHPVLIVAAFFTAADDDLDWLDAYAEAGGHLVLGPRTAYADREGRARLDVKPSRLTRAAGVTYDEFANLERPVAVDGTDGFTVGADAGTDAVATDWVDGLTLDGATALASYRHPHFGRWPAVTTNAYGSGRVTTVGTLPGQSLARALAEWLVPEPIAGWGGLPESVTVSTSTSADGDRIHYLHNWSWDEATAEAPFALTDLLDARSFDAGEAINLGPWDVRVVAGSASATTPSVRQHEESL
jgi:beta-galactosidase